MEDINYGIIETEKIYDIIYFFAVIVGKTNFNTQKPVSDGYPDQRFESYRSLVKYPEQRFQSQ